MPYLSPNRSSCTMARIAKVLCKNDNLSIIREVLFLSLDQPVTKNQIPVTKLLFCLCGNSKIGETAFSNCKNNLLLMQLMKHFMRISVFKKSKNWIIEVETIQRRKYGVNSHVSNKQTGWNKRVGWKKSHNQ